MERVKHIIDATRATKDCKFKTLSAELIEDTQSDYGHVFTIGMCADSQTMHPLTISMNATFNCQTSVFGGIQGCTYFIKNIYSKPNWRYGGNVVLNMILSLLFKVGAETKTQFIIDYCADHNDEITTMFNLITSGGEYTSTNDSDMNVGIINLPIEDITDEDVSHIFKQAHTPDYDEDDEDDEYYDEDEDDE